MLHCKSNRLRKFILSLILLYCCSCTHIPPVLCPLRLRAGSKFQIAYNEKKGWGYFSHPLIVGYDKDLVVVYYNTVGDMPFCPTITVDEEGKLLPEYAHAGRGPAVSSDGGISWRIARPRFKGVGLPRISDGYPQRSASPAFNFSVTDLPDGRMAAYLSPVLSVDGRFGRNSYITSVMFRDNCGTWREPRDVVFTCHEAPCNGIRDVIHLAPRAAVLPDGAIVTVGYTTYKGDRIDDPLKCAVFAFRSVDGGYSYEYFNVVATSKDAPWGDEGPCEPAIALMPDGDLLCVMRTGDNKLQGPAHAAFPMLEARSNDGGRSWKLKKMNIAGVMPKLLVMKNGVVVLGTGRPGNMLYFSLDSGRSWCREFAVTPADILTSGYLDILEVSDGRLLIVFDIYNSPLESFWLWEPTYVNGILGMFVEVKRR